MCVCPWLWLGSHLRACVCVCAHVVDSGSVFKHILIYVRGADFCLLISHLDDHSIRFNQKKILSFTFPLLSLSFCWQRYKKERIREREREQQRHRARGIKTSGSLTKSLLGISVSQPSFTASHIHTPELTPQPHSLRRQPAALYPQSPAQPQHHNEKSY